MIDTCCLQWTFAIFCTLPYTLVLFSFKIVGDIYPQEATLNQLKYWKWKWSSSVVQSCLTLCNPMDGSLPRSSLHGLEAVGKYPSPLPFTYISGVHAT